MSNFSFSCNDGCFIGNGFRMSTSGGNSIHVGGTGLRIDVAGQQPVAEMGEILTEKREVKPFEKIEASGPISVRVVSTGGEQESVKVEADRAYMPLIITQAEHGTLAIRIAEGHSLAISGKIQVTVSAKRIRNCVVSDGAHVLIEKNIAAPHVSLKARMGHMAIALGDSTEFVKCDVSGTGGIDLHGPAEKLQLEVSGAGKINCSELRSQEVAADVSGAGLIHLDGATQKANLDVSGAGKIDASNLRSQETLADVSGTGKVTTWTEKALRAEVSGVGSIRYKGNPRVNRSFSGLGRIERL